VWPDEILYLNAFVLIIHKPFFWYSIL
jgi:hypothetical protein